MRSRRPGPGDPTFEREHTTPFIWDQPERFALGNVAWSTGKDLSSTVRLTLDYEEDYQLISAVFKAARPADGPAFTVEAIVAYLDWHPEVRALNAASSGHCWMHDHAAELRTLGGHRDPRPATPLWSLR